MYLLHLKLHRAFVKRGHFILNLCVVHILTVNLHKFTVLYHHFILNLSAFVKALMCYTEK